jgi:threonine dehydrogenase-like Zn-dependent dehydrogenase
MSARELRELVATSVRKAELLTYRDGPLPPDHVRVAVEFAAPKHGTEMHLYRGHAANQPWAQFPFGLGNMFVGRVAELGSAVKDIAPGARVAGYSNLRPTVTCRPEHLLRLPDRMTPKEAVCYDPAQFALAGIRDGHVRPGDAVAVFGLGAIGLMAVQMARMAGADFVAAVDPLAVRRGVAARIGAHLTLDPNTADVPKALKDATAGRGVDVAIETSAAAEALDTALRGLAYGGTVSYVGWPIRFEGGPDFGALAHFEVPNLIFARACSEPLRDHPRWTFKRICETCWQWLAEGRFQCEDIVQPVIPFEEALAMVRTIDEHPEACVKFGVRF